jgi:hypothetical protein
MAIPQTTMLPSVTGGRTEAKVSESDIFDYANATGTPVTPQRQRMSHTDNPRRANDGDSEEDIFAGVFDDDPAPVRPYAGPRGQWD